MIGEQVEERRLFTYEERKQALKRSYNICTCCGKKLTTKTMTVEHIIPLSRGGTNEPENLVALCEACNKLKSNMLYMPYGFYSAIREKPLYHEIERYVRKWFDTKKDEFDIERFPLISPQTFVQLDPASSIDKKSNKFTFVNSLIFKYQMVNKNTYDEIEAVTNVDIDQMRRYLRNYDREDKSMIPIYCMKRVNSDKILMLFAIKYDKDGKTFRIHIPWHCMPKQYAASAVFNFIGNLLDTIINITKNEITQYLITSPYENVFYAFTKRRSMPRFIGIGYEWGYMEDEQQKKDEDSAYAMMVYRIANPLEK